MGSVLRLQGGTELPNCPREGRQGCKDLKDTHGEEVGIRDAWGQVLRERTSLGLESPGAGAFEEEVQGRGLAELPGAGPGWPVTTPLFTKR